MLTLPLNMTNRCYFCMNASQACYLAYQWTVLHAVASYKPRNSFSRGLTTAFRLIYKRDRFILYFRKGGKVWSNF